MAVLDLITVSTTCPVCGTKSTLQVDRARYRAWQNGYTSIFEDAFPDLSEAENEQLLSGMCKECFDS